MNYGYTDFFGKKVTHQEAINKRISDLLVNILMNVNQISEKDFKRYDEQIALVKDFVNKNTFVLDKANEYNDNNKRLELLAEELYDKHFKNEHTETPTVIDESLKIKSFDEFIK